jgi:hypothetical protein
LNKQDISSMSCVELHEEKKEKGVEPNPRTMFKNDSF